MSEAVRAIKKQRLVAALLAITKAAAHRRTLRDSPESDPPVTVSVMFTPGRWFAPLHESRFRLFFVGQLTSRAGSAMVPVALVFAVIDSVGKRLRSVSC